MKTKQSLILGGLPTPSRIQVFEQPSPPDLKAYLYGPIEDEEDYVDLVHTIQYGAPGQDMILHINSPGGNLNVCLALVNAINSTQANVTTIVDGEAASAAAMIWLAGHNRMIASPHVIVMLHTAATSFFGSKLPEIRGGVDVTNKIIEGLMDDLTKGFLTEEEREDIRKGVDVWLTGSEIIERIGGDEEDAVETQAD